MAQTHLFNPELNAEMKILKERRRTYPGGVPTAGSSPRRREFWSADPIPGLEVPAEKINLLLCWDYASEDSYEDFRLRVVRAVEPGVYGQAVRCDLMIDIDAGGSIHRDQAFLGSDDPEDFFGTVDIRKEDNGA